MMARSAHPSARFYKPILAQAIADVGASAAYVESNIPVTSMGGSDDRGKGFEMPAVVAEPFAAPIGIEVAIVGEHHVALSVAVHAEGLATFQKFPGMNEVHNAPLEKCCFTRDKLLNSV